MATNFNVSIGLSAPTVKSLRDGGFQLYAFKAVESSRSDGVPVIWFKTKTFNETTEIGWATQYQAYYAAAEDIPNGKITASASANIDLGQTYHVDPGSNRVTNDGQNGAISIQNEVNEQYSCGISEVVAGKAQPLCAFPLFGGSLDIMAPVQKILLMFATQPFDMGSVVHQSFGRAMTITYFGATSRSVSYDINNGWDWGNQSWGQQLRPQANLLPELILHQQRLADFATGEAQRRLSNES